MNAPADHAPAGDSGGYIPLSRGLKDKIKDGIVAFTMANWCFIRTWAHLLFDGNRYYDRVPVTSGALLALAANIFWLTAVIWLGVLLWHRVKSKFLSLILDLLFLGLLIFPADYIRVEILNLVGVGGMGALLKKSATIPVLIVWAVVVAWKHRLMARSVALVVSITLPVALLTMAKVLLISAGAMDVRQCPNPCPPPLSPVQGHPPRVVWIIFDETDYRLAYEKRPANLRLPEFDRLRSESLFADHAYAPADRTILSMPALISGRRLANSTCDGCDLALTLDDTRANVEWTSLPSVFSEARKLGVNTALVGWYIPYTRLLGASLNYCSWYAMPVFEPATAPTFGESFVKQIACLGGPFHSRQLFADICQDSLRDAVAVAPDPNFGLVLLHLPPPHLPGVYLADKGEFTCLGMGPAAGYFGNLALADHELGAIRGALEKASQWDNTWVILSADHSWRHSQSYDGTRDYRVPYVVKCPGPAKPLAYSRQFNTLLTHDLILSILRGQVTNQAGVVAALDAGKPDLPVPGAGEATE